VLQVAVCDTTRALDKAFGSYIKCGYSVPFTTTNANLWLIGNVPGVVMGKGRPMLLAERARLSGVLPESLIHACKTSAIHGLGNMMPVNVVGMVLNQVMCVMKGFETYCLRVDRPVPWKLLAEPAGIAEDDEAEDDEAARPAKRSVLEMLLHPSGGNVVISDRSSSSSSIISTPIAPAEGVRLRRLYKGKHDMSAYSSGSA
jgi:hypothetical protein